MTPAEFAWTVFPYGKNQAGHVLVRELALDIAARDAEIRAAERERCAKVCDVRAQEWRAWQNAHPQHAAEVAQYREVEAGGIATAIRALGDPS